MCFQYGASGPEEREGRTLQGHTRGYWLIQAGKPRHREGKGPLRSHRASRISSPPFPRGVRKHQHRQDNETTSHFLPLPQQPGGDSGGWLQGRLRWGSYRQHQARPAAGPLPCNHHRTSKEPQALWVLLKHLHSLLGPAPLLAPQLPSTHYVPDPVQGSQA